MKDFKNILAINFGGIGDELFFLPSLISLKKEFSNSKQNKSLYIRRQNSMSDNNHNFYDAVNKIIAERLEK